MSDQSKLFIIKQAKARQYFYTYIYIYTYKIYFKIYIAYSFVSNVFIPKIMLGYAPNTTIGIQKLIMGVIRSISLQPMDVSSFANCDELRIRAYSEQYIASICFHNVDESQRGLPLFLNFSILMPSELRFYEDTWIGNLWMVNNVYDTGHDAIVESENSSYSTYVREGFISLQYYLCAEYLHIASGNATIPTVILRELKMGTDINELIAEGVDTSVLVLLIGFMFPVTVFTKVSSSKYKLRVALESQ